jgi:ribonuclease P protein component
MDSAPAWQPKTPSQPATATRKTDGARWPRRRRLLSRAEFRAIYETGMRRSSPHFTLFGRLRPAPTGEEAGARFGITASRKLGAAVTRNRIRRRTRELLRRQTGVATAWHGDVVVNPRASVATAEFAALAIELEEQLRRLRAALLREAT